MSEVKRYAFFAYIDEGDNAEFDYHIESDGSWVKASDYDQLKAENERLKAENEEWSPVMQKLGDQNDTLRKQLDQTTEECEYLANENVEFKLMIFNLRKQLDEARELLIKICSHHLEGNIRATVRDCVNGLPCVQDIYEYCDNIDADIYAWLESCK